MGSRTQDWEGAMCYFPLDEDEESHCIDVVVPQLGEAVATAVLIVWFVEQGFFTMKGEPLLEIGTDKTVFQIEAEVDGVLEEVRVWNGETVEAGEVVGRIRTT